MVTFNVDGNLGKFKINLPTNLNEITVDYLNKIAENVKLADNYSLIGVCYREKLYNLILSLRQNKKKVNSMVVPIFVKAGKTDSEFINGINIKDKLIISASNISLGQHIVSPYNELDIDRILNIVVGDSNIYQNALANNEYCYFLEFKVVPNCNIIGNYISTPVVETENTFITKEDSEG